MFSLSLGINKTKNPNSNIIGSFKTENGIIQKEIYQKNPNYKLFNKKGLFSTHPYFEEILYSEINKIIFGNQVTKLKANQLNNNKFNTQLIYTEDDNIKTLTFNNIGSIDKIPNTFYIGIIKIDVKTNEIISFDPNNKFVTFLHSVIKEYGSENPMMVSAGKSQENGWIYIIDARTPTPQGDVPPEDIIGAFEVKNGILSKESYNKFDKHLLISSNGLFGLDGYMSIILLDIMKQNIEKENIKTESP